MLNYNRKLLLKLLQHQASVKHVYQFAAILICNWFRDSEQTRNCWHVMSEHWLRLWDEQADSRHSRLGTFNV